MNVAIIITAFNRKAKTLACIERLYEHKHSDVDFTIFLTDDASSDGTADAVAERFPEVVISKGDGNLYYSRGTNLSWERAVKEGGFDGYLLHNDDTEILPHFWDELLEVDTYCKNKYGKGGIYAGATVSLDGSHMTYGASKNKGGWRNNFQLVEPNGEFQECDIANGNITYVSDDVVKELGCFYPGYVHGYGEYDYILTAHKKGIPVLLMRSYVGKCDDDHTSHHEILLRKNLKDRIKYLYAPAGLRFKDGLLFQKRHCPQYYLPMFVSYWIRTLFPKLHK